MELLWRTIATSHITRCTTDTHLHTITFSPLKMHKHMACTIRSVDMCHLFLTKSIKHHFDTFTLLLSTLNINLRGDVHSITVIQLTPRTFFIMDATHYWPFAREYSIWNAAVTALKFWMADLNLQTLSNVTEWVYTAFFWSNSAKHLNNISEEILFGHFTTTLNNTFEWELALEDGRYQSGSESLSISAPLHGALCLHHISASENFLLDLLHLKHTHLTNLATSMPCTTIWCLKKMTTPQLTATHSMLEESTTHLLNTQWLTTSPVQMKKKTKTKMKKKTSQQLHWTDDVWKEEPIQDRHLCIHEHSQHDLCPYPCPYSLDQLLLVPNYASTPHYMDLSDIFDFPHVITNTSNEEIPHLEDILKL